MLLSIATTSSFTMTIGMMREGLVRILAEATDDAAAVDANVTALTDSATLDQEILVGGEVGETRLEEIFDAILGTCFLITAIFAAKRMTWTRQQGGAETTVVTAFYSLILITSILRALWFLIPATVWQPSYTPIAVFAWDSNHPAWMGAALSEVVLTAGSLALFSIFIPFKIP